MQNQDPHDQADYIIYNKELLHKHLSLFLGEHLIRFQVFNSIKLFIQKSHPLLFLFFQLLISYLNCTNLF